MSSLATSTVFETNPYEGHPNLTELEAEVLWQYAQLSQNIKEVRSAQTTFVVSEVNPYGPACS